MFVCVPGEDGLLLSFEYVLGVEDLPLLNFKQDTIVDEHLRESGAR